MFLARVFVATAFWPVFLITLGLMATALVTGWRRFRRAHLWLGPLAMLGLLVTVLLTEQLARRYEFPEGPMAIHLLFAKSAALLAVPVIVTGVLLARRPRARRAHRIAVLLFLLATLIATGTGIWIFSLAEPR